MKILYIHQHFSTPKGSAGTRSYEMAQNLIRSGHQVTLICGSHQLGSTGLSAPFSKGFRRGLVDGIEVIEIQIPYSNHATALKRISLFLQFSWKCIQFVFREKFDLLFATSTPLTVAIPGIILKYLKPKSRFVFEVRDLWPELIIQMKTLRNPFFIWLLRRLENLAYKKADHIIALSPGIKKGIEDCGISPNKVSLIPNGSDLELFRPKMVGERFSEFEPNDFLAVFAGAHGPANGLDNVLDAAQVLLNRNNMSIKFVFIGEGKSKTGLIARKNAEKIDNCFFWPAMPKEKLAHCMGFFDVGLMVLANKPGFYFGTSPNKFFDFISSGLPVINNYPGWLANLIDNHGCGIVCRPDDPESFADALEFLQRHPEERLKMATSARLLAENEFDRKILADRFQKVLENEVQLRLNQA